MYGQSDSGIYVCGVRVPLKLRVETDTQVIQAASLLVVKANFLLSRVSG